MPSTFSSAKNAARRPSATAWTSSGSPSRSVCLDATPLTLSPETDWMNSTGPSSGAISGLAPGGTGIVNRAPPSGSAVRSDVSIWPRSVSRTTA